MNTPAPDEHDATRLPMPGDTGPTAPTPRASNDLDDTPLPMPAEPADTLEILTGGADRSEDSKSGTSDGSSMGSAGASSAGGTGLDTILGRLVVEQGLATDEEVRSAISARGSELEAEANLSEWLIKNGAITQAQLLRLKRQLEAERSGQRIPGYRVLGKLGAGAMAAVFKAQQISLDRHVAIKVLPRKFNNNQQFIERFYAEGRAAAQLNHPNIVQAYDVGRSGEFHYFVMEYVDGSTVHDTIVQNKRFEEQLALDIAIAVAEALEHAHSKGLIHRDVKPKNIMITKGGVVKLADLGLARAIDDKDAALAEKGKAYGTPYYISPEQIRGEINVGPQADIYSLGATLYHMVTGNVPFNGKSPKEVMEKHLKEALVPPDHVNSKLSAGISEVIEMMMSKSRRARYKNCADLLSDLRAVKRGELPPIAHKDATAEVLADFTRLQAEQQPGQVPIDSTSIRTGPSTVMLSGLIIAIIYGLVMTVVVFLQIFATG